MFLATETIEVTTVTTNGQSGELYRFSGASDVDFRRIKKANVTKHP